MLTTSAAYRTLRDQSHTNDLIHEAEWGLESSLCNSLGHRANEVYNLFLNGCEVDQDPSWFQGVVDYIPSNQSRSIVW
jgi:DNA-binding protein Fis